MGRASGRIRTYVCLRVRRSDGSQTSARRGNEHSRTRADNGQLRQKRGDTLVGNLEREYDVDFGVRSDMQLGTLRDRTGLTSIDALVSKARQGK
jgi:hypothetical protein